jgi:Flp pilus assembly protein TadB
MAEPNNSNGNGVIVGIEVLAERIANLSKKLDEQIALSKTAVDAALTAIQVAKSDQERTVTVAFAASQSAITKTEQSQKESNQNIGVLQNDVVRLKESQAQSSGTRGGIKEAYGYIFGVIMAIITVYMALHK